MARPQGITDEEVLAAARAVFLSKGISATMEEVAERCHVGVATIFRRFPSKQALFTAATALVSETDWARFLAKQAEASRSGDARSGLLELARTMLESARQVMPLIMLRFSNPALVDRHEAGQRASWVLRALTEYFQVEIDAKRLIEVDPRVAARTWLGAIRHIVVLETFGPSVDGLTTDQYIEGLADMFFRPTGKRTRR
jgi:AcrR family transcriptional regulator